MTFIALVGISSNKHRTRQQVSTGLWKPSQKMFFASGSVFTHLGFPLWQLSHKKRCSYHCIGLRRRKDEFAWSTRPPAMRDTFPLSILHHWKFQIGINTPTQHENVRDGSGGESFLLSSSAIIHYHFSSRRLASEDNVELIKLRQKCGKRFVNRCGI